MPVEQRYRRKTEETKMTERKRKIVNLAYSAEHRISILLSPDGRLDFNS